MLMVIVCKDNQNPNGDEKLKLHKMKKKTIVLPKVEANFETFPWGNKLRIFLKSGSFPKFYPLQKYHEEKFIDRY